jgi:hypothetical protein
MVPNGDSRFSKSRCIRDPSLRLKNGFVQDDAVNEEISDDIQFG